MMSTPPRDRSKIVQRGLFHVMAPSTKTYVAKPTDRERNWLVVDANGKTLGRLATQIADVLRGKRKPEYTPHIDTGDFVVVVNAEKIHVTGNKRKDKRYYRHSGYPGGLRSRTFEEMLARRPGGDHQAGREGHDAAQPARAKADHEAQDLRRARASARRPEAATVGDRAMMADEEKPETPAEKAETPPRSRPRTRRRRRRRARSRDGGRAPRREDAEGLSGVGGRREEASEIADRPPRRPAGGGRGGRGGPAEAVRSGRRRPRSPSGRRGRAAGGAPGGRGEGRGASPGRGRAARAAGGRAALAGEEEEGGRAGAHAAREAVGAGGAPGSGHRPRGRRPARAKRGLRGSLRDRGRGGRAGRGEAIGRRMRRRRSSLSRSPQPPSTWPRARATGPRASARRRSPG